MNERLPLVSTPEKIIPVGFTQEREGARILERICC